MERNWEYRKFHKNRVYKKRLKSIAHQYHWYIGEFFNKIQEPRWYHLLDGRYFIYKNVSTTKWDSKYKDKWRNKQNYRNKKSRILHKRETFKILQEYEF